MNEGAMDLLSQLEAAEQRLIPFIEARDSVDVNKPWITDNDRAVLERVMAVIKEAKCMNTAAALQSPIQTQKHYSLSPSFALTAALKYIYNHRHSLSPISSPLVSLIDSPHQHSKARRKTSPLTNAPSLPMSVDIDVTEEEANTTDNNTTKNTTFSAKLNSVAATSTVSSTSFTKVKIEKDRLPPKKTVEKKFGIKFGKKKRAFGGVLSINTLNNNNRGGRKSPFKQNKRLVHSSSSNSFVNTTNVLETF